MKIRIGSQTYDAATLDRVTLGNIIKLESETAELGRPMKWPEIRSMASRIQSLEPDEVEDDGDLLWFLGLLVWGSRLEAGEKVTFGEAVDFPMGDLEFIASPQDHRAPADPHQARPASVRAAKRPTKKRTPRTSAKA